MADDFRYWQGDASAAAQVDSMTPADVESTDVFTATLMDERGNTQSVAFTATAATVANVTAGLSDAMNASVLSLFTRVTAADDTTHITVTADTAGVPFYLTSTTTDGGGTDDQALVRAAVTASSGPNDWNVAENWYSPGNADSVPLISDDVVLDPRYGVVPILYGLDQSAGTGGLVRTGGVEHDSFRVLAGFTAAIGGTDGAYLQFDMGSSEVFEFAGTGTAYIDIADADVDPIIRNTASATTGNHGLYLKGTAVSDLTLLKGNIGYGVEAGDITSQVDNIVVGQVGSQASDVALTIGTGVTGTAGAVLTLITQNGGTVVNRAATTTLVTKHAGTYTQEDGLWTTLTQYGGIAYSDSDGTCANTNIFGGSSVLNTRDLRTKTFTTTTIQKGGTLNDPAGRITFTNPISLEDCGLGDVTLVSGKNQTITITAV